jgi:hypothetical protein
MDDPNNTTGPHEADEDILTYTVSDEAIEAAVGIEGGVMSTAVANWCSCAQVCWALT